MVIYKITNIITNDFYIGKTKNAEKRFYNHKYKATNNRSQTHFHRAIRKYGIENFIFSILENVESEELLNEREIFWIKELNPHYNMTMGGDGGDTSNSLNYKEAIKKVHANKNRNEYATYGMQGKKHSDKTKNSLRKANSYPVSCEGTIYNSVGDAQKAYPGISIRKRLDSKKYPTFFRIKPKRGSSSINTPL